jgi:hypothetical protein
MKVMFKIPEDKKIKEMVKRSLRPDEKFVNRSEAVFLASFRTAFPDGQTAPSNNFGLFLRGTTTFVAILFLMTGASAYADSQDVGPNHILYPLKKSFEQLSAMVTNQKGPLYAKYAERRLKEIKTAKIANPQDARIAGLTKELKNNIKLSVENTDLAEKNKGKTFVRNFPPLTKSTEVQINNESSGSIVPNELSAPENDSMKVQGFVPAPLSAPARNIITTTSLNDGLEAIPGVQADNSKIQGFEPTPQPAEVNVANISNLPESCGSLKNIVESNEPEINTIMQEDYGLASKLRSDCELDF